MCHAASRYVPQQGQAAASKQASILDRTMTDSLFQSADAKSYERNYIFDLISFLLYYFLFLKTKHKSASDPADQQEDKRGNLSAVSLSFRSQIP